MAPARFIKPAYIGQTELANVRGISAFARVSVATRVSATSCR
jgi:hypothetical protein